MINYILKSSLSLIILFGLYWFLLRKEKLFVFNRFFLILSILFSLAVPLISIPVNFLSSYVPAPFISANEYINPEINLINNSLPDDFKNIQAFPEKQTSVPNVKGILIGLYISGLVFFLIRFLRNLYIISRRTKKSERIRSNGHQIILTDELMDPCCFFRNIYLNRDDYLNGKIDIQILDHEFEHARQAHTIDIILIELVKIFYWFNPVHVLYDRAIRMNHEYLADNEVIKHLPDIEAYSDKLLGFLVHRINLSMTSGSNHSYTGQRLMMMMKSGSERLINITRIGITIFLGTLFFILLSFKETHEQSIVSGYAVAETGVMQSIIKGIVMTEDGIPLTGATIKTTDINDALIETLTDFDGRFTIEEIASGASLTVSYRGFLEKKMPPDFSSDMIVKLVRDPNFKDPVFATITRTASFRNPDFSPAGALFVIGGVIKEYKDDLRIKPDEIKMLRVLKGNEAMIKYGKKAKDGAVEVTLYEDITGGEKISGSLASDSSKYRTLISINHVTNKGEIIDIPVSNLQSVTSWTYHYLDNIDKKELRTISIMTRDYYKVRGTVVTEKGKPLAGVKITATDNPVTETSDKNGYFELSDVRSNVLMEFSLQGYKPYYLATTGAVFTLDLTIPLQSERSRNNDIYEIAEKMPHYPGGESELLKFIATNTQYPDAARSQNAEGRVIVRFVINTEGYVKNASVLKGVHPALDTEALRVIGRLEKFEPATIGGKPVNIYYMVPITFTINKKHN